MSRKLPESVRCDAWIGDAVLSLFAREWLLRECGETDGDRERAMTNNQFLAAFGNPTEVEARIGRMYRDEGMDAAFAWIESTIMPVFLAQERRRIRTRSAVR